MTTKIVTLTHPAAPQEALDFFHYLLANFPLNKTNQLSIEFLPRNSIGKSAWGRCYYVEARNLNTWIRVALGSSKERRPLPGLLKTLAHEYCHAMQYDQGQEGDCAEADQFAYKIVPEFLSKQMKVA